MENQCFWVVGRGTERQTNSKTCCCDAFLGLEGLKGPTWVPCRYPPNAQNAKTKVCSAKLAPSCLACCAFSGPSWAQKCKKHEKPKEKQCFLKAPAGPREAQKGSQKYLAGARRCNQPLFWAILGSSWAILWPPWPCLGGLGWHLEAFFGFGGAESVPRCKKMLKCQKP